MIGQRVERCEADVHQSRAHTCDDPVGCGVDQMIAGPDEQTVDLDALHELLDRIEELCEGSKAVVAQRVLSAIHTERSGPR